MYDEPKLQTSLVGSGRSESQVERLDRQIKDGEDHLAKMKALKEKLEKNPEVLEIFNLMRSVGI